MRRLNKLASYILIVTIILSSFSFSYADNNVEFDWERHFSFGNLIDLRYDTIPAVNNNGDIYVTVTDGRLYCIKPDGTRKWDLNIFQKGEENLIGGVSPVFDKQGNAYIGSGDKNVYSIDTDGNILWKFKMSDDVAPGTSPILHKDVVYVSSKNRMLYAINKENGEEIWSKKINGRKSCNTPVVYEDENENIIIYISTARTMSAISSDGKELWSEKFEDEALYDYGQMDVSEKRIDVDKEGNVYFVTFEWGTDVNHNDEKTKLYKYNSKGKQEWSKDINKNVTAPNVYKEKVYYKTSDNRLHALSTEDGKEIWQYKADEDYFTTPQHYTRPVAIGADGTIYVGFGKNLYAIDSKSEKVKWKTTNGNYDVYTVSKPSSNGEIYCIAGLVGKHKIRLLKCTDESFEQVIENIEIKDEDFCMLENGEYKLNVILKDSYNRLVSNIQDIQYESTTPDIISVDNNGNIKPLKEGSAQITASYKTEKGNINDSVNINVIKYSGDMSIEISPKNTQMLLDDKVKLSYKITTKDKKEVKGEKVNFTSTIPLIATINQENEIEPKNLGQTIIRAASVNYPDLKIQTNISVVKTKISKVNINEIKEAIRKTSTYLQRKPGTSDWAAVALNSVDEDISQNYLKKLEQEIKEDGVGNLVTDYERTALAVVSAGGDPTNFADIDLIDEIVNYKDFSQGINAAVWGLIAVDGCNAVIDNNAKYDREYLVDYILNNMSGDGWAFGGGSTPDADMTGMGLYALAPYKDDPKVKEAGEIALKWLSENQLSNGTFGSWGSVNSESCSQAVIGITSWGIDPQGSEFTKSGGNAVTGLLNYQVENGMFKHIDSPDPGMATHQGLQALGALKEYMEAGKSTIFYKIKYNAGENEEVTSIEISPNSLELKSGTKIKMSVKNQSRILIDNSKVDWESSDENIAVIDEKGVLIAKSEGTVNIIASLKEDETVKDSITVEVVKDEFTVQLKGSDLDNKKNIVINITNNSNKNKKALVVIGLYDKNTSNLIEQTYVSKEFVAGQVDEINTNLQVPEDRDYEVKVMIWNDWVKARSLVDAVTLENK
ncbi:PQQ-binding-like beta-propeller repeat protein [Tepidibacter hydrothermalis]|uniref:PQQ-binding-like beta-propeller repeat protein n=1 Tax=Tepidibacter hydrothermalis TaxID=3036126 RepID=A0ABY8EIN4_9FIRM|nr:PQQ-binding-like beta-propeller repeat protein [Tepidibacter hydrothermalis]WFD10708.1 PQQ-binding-like beta-propeller repeat protein [Tepidibacter hydrothermalis]